MAERRYWMMLPACDSTAPSGPSGKWAVDLAAGESFFSNSMTDISTHFGLALFILHGLTTGYLPYTLNAARMDT